MTLVCGGMPTATPRPSGARFRGLAAPARRAARLQSPVLLRLAAIFYVTMALAALGLNALRGVPLVPLDFGPRLAPALAAAALMTLATLIFTTFGARRWSWIQELEATFRRILGPHDLGAVAFYALASGISEELFFRGALQPALIRVFGSEMLGLLVATIAFTAAHVPMERGLRFWPAFVFVLGLFLGAVTLACGNVLPAVLCHATINFVNLRRITRPIARS